MKPLVPQKILQGSRQFLDICSGSFCLWHLPWKIPRQKVCHIAMGNCKVEEYHGTFMDHYLNSEPYLVPLVMIHQTNYLWHARYKSPISKMNNNSVHVGIFVSLGLFDHMIGLSLTKNPYEDCSYKQSWYVRT